MPCYQIVIKVIENMAPALATLAAAFFGAKYAFKLQDGNARRESDSRNVRAANLVIFDLVRSYNMFTTVKKQFIDQHRENAERHLLIMPIAGVSFQPPRFDYDAISFLFNSNPNLLGTLSTVEQEIASTLDVIRQRSTMHVEVLQPAVETLAKRFGDKFNSAQIEAALGPRIAITLRTSTTYMIEGIERVILECGRHIELLRSETQKAYPGHKVIGMLAPATSLPNTRLEE